MGSEADRIRAEYERRERTIDPGRYAVTAPENLMTAQELERLLIDALRSCGKLPLRGLRILDVGCGWGGWMSAFESWGAQREHLAGLELFPESARATAARLPGSDVREGDAAALPWQDNSFDVVFQSMMFSSILDAGVRASAASEMARVLAPGGVVLWYDFFVADPRNRSTVGIGRRELRRLFPGFDLSLRRATLAPPLARAVVGRSRPLGLLLGAVRVFDSHYAGTLSRAR